MHSAELALLLWLALPRGGKSRVKLNGFTYEYLRLKLTWSRSERRGAAGCAVCGEGLAWPSDQAKPGQGSFCRLLPTPAIDEVEVAATGPRV